MYLKNLRLSIANVARTASETTLLVNNTGIAYKRDETGKATSDIEWYTITCTVNRGDSLKIKFPPTIESKFNELQEQIKRDCLIKISFQNLHLIPYAMQTPNGVLSGVSAKADDFIIVPPTNGEALSDELDIEP